jgi:hypothetical protein
MSPVTSQRRLALGVGVGILLGILYTVSPLGVIATILAFILVGLAGRGLPTPERRQLTAMLALALIARLIAIATIFLVAAPQHDDQFVGASGGDEAYNLARALRTRDVVLGVSANKYDYLVVFDEYGRNSYVTFLSGVQLVFGPTPYSMRLFNAVVYLSGAVMIFRLIRRAMGSLPGLIGLAVVLFLPSLFAASIALLKESIYFAGSALMLTAAYAAIGSPTWRLRLVATAGVALGAAVIHDLRPAAVSLAIAGLVTGLAVYAIASSRRLLIGAAALAGIAVVAVVVTPTVQRRIAAALETTAQMQTGHVFTVGHAYKLLDEGFYFDPRPPGWSALMLTPEQDARYVARALASFIVVPMPWQAASMRELVFLPEQMVWYTLIALLPLGVWAGWQRDRLATCLFVAYAVPMAIAVALTNGNIGTLLRLRGLVTPFIAWISAVGFCSFLETLERTA